MRATAQFHRPAQRVAGGLAHGDDADLVAIFLAEQGSGTGLLGFLDTHQPGFDRGVLEHDGVGDVFHCGQFLVGDRLGVDEVEAQPLGRYQRALLGNMIAQHDA